MRFRTFVCTLALFGPAYPASSSPTQNIWRDYVNVRYGFSICYPRMLLIAQGEADNSDGQTFKARDGAELRVFGSNNVFGHSLNHEADADAQEFIGTSGKITYHMSRPDWVVISGEDGRGMAFYFKKFARDDQFITFQISYPRALDQRYKPIVERLSRCFRLTEGHV